MKIEARGRIHAVQDKFQKSNFQKTEAVLKVPGERYDDYLSIQFTGPKADEVPSVGTEVEVTLWVNGRLDKNDSKRAWMSLNVANCNVISGAQDTQQDNPF